MLHGRAWAGTRFFSYSATHAVAAFNNNASKWKRPWVSCSGPESCSGAAHIRLKSGGIGSNFDITVCSVDGIWKGLAFNLRTLTGYTHSFGHSNNDSLKARSCSTWTVICNVNMMYSLEVVHWQWLCGLTQCLSEFLHPNRLFTPYCNRSKKQQHFFEHCPVKCQRQICTRW